MGPFDSVLWGIQGVYMVMRVWGCRFEAYGVHGFRSLGVCGFGF